MYSTFMSNLGDRVRAFREQKNWSQSKLARTANISNDYVSRIELNKVSNVGLDTLGAIAKALEIAPAELQYGDQFGRDLAGIVDAPHNRWFEVPLLTGTVSAGDFSQDFTSWEGQTMPLPQKPKKSWVAWEIKGRSMEPEYYSGDVVVLDTEAQTVDGCDVVARKNGGEITIKRLKILKDGSIELRPYNPDFETLKFGGEDEVKAVGVVVKLIRDMTKRR